MKTQLWFQKDKSSAQKNEKKRPLLLGAPLLDRKSGVASEASRFASRLRPHDLIAMLTHHYTRVRARSLPKVKTSLSVQGPRGKQAVTISFG
jgi:hypothetical protein